MTSVANFADDSAPRSRILQFAGGCNFRDLGGYRTRDDRPVAWGKVYRTGVLSYFGEADHEGLRKLRVTAICDLRRAAEREREPTRWPDQAATLMHFDDGPAPPTIATFAAQHPYTADGMRNSMFDLYRALPTWMAPRLQGMCTRILEDRGATIVHCAAGKDRTGVAIALLLAALDVPREVIIDDYMLTNRCDFEAFIVSKHEAQLGVATSKHPLLSIPEDIRRVVLGVEVDYLDATFEQIERNFGGVEPYLENQLGLNAARRERLREVLLRK